MRLAWKVRLGSLPLAQVAHAPHLGAVRSTMHPKERPTAIQERAAPAESEQLAALETGTRTDISDAADDVNVDRA